jgi:kumamolisin
MMPDSHVILPGSRRPPPSDAVRLRDADSTSSVDVTVTLKGPDLPPMSAMPQKALSRAEVEKLYGVPAETVLKVERTLGQFGLKVRSVKQGGRSLRMRGSVSAVQEAFHPNLGIYEVPGQGQVRAREGELSIPAELDGLVTGVYGIDQRRVALRHLTNRTAKPALRALQVDPMTPAQLREHYDFPGGGGAGKTIAIAEFGSPLSNGSVLAPAYIPSDVEAFCQQNGTAVPTIKVVSVGLSPISKAQFDAQKAEDGPLFPELEDSTIETMMDVQIVAGLCPDANIDLYFAPWGEGGWIDLIDEATSGDDAPVALSISYGLFEEAPDWSQGVLDRINHRLQLASLRGVTVCVSAGDDGTKCQAQDHSCHTEFPSSSPFVLAVGGTQLDAGADGRPVEVVWRTAPGWRKPRTGGGATGGGVSRLNPLPPWQTVHVASLNPGAGPGRIVPDVAALSGAPFYAMMFDGEVFPGGGGTSAATPLWASLIALVDAALPADKQQRFWPPLLYQEAVSSAGFTDIVSGDNTATPAPGIGYQAQNGFDAVTGWGAPSGKALARALGA